MSNPINLLSETCFSEKLTRQNILLAALASQSGGIALTSWADLQKAVRMGVASKIFSVGDRLSCRRGSQTIVWEVIGIDHDTPTDPALTHSLTLQAHDLVAVLPYDPAEPSNPDANRAERGSNLWRQSSIRQWLNSSSGVGEWWSAQHDCDAEPSYAKTMAGFLWSMDEDFLAAVGEVEKVTALNSVTDGGGSEVMGERFFLLSRAEVYAGSENGISEGEAYPYYAEHSESEAAAVSADANRIKYRNGTAQSWWLRTPYTDSTQDPRMVTAAGAVKSGGASGYQGIAPACCIV